MPQYLASSSSSLLDNCNHLQQERLFHNTSWFPWSEALKGYGKWLGKSCICKLWSTHGALLALSALFGDDKPWEFPGVIRKSSPEPNPPCSKKYKKTRRETSLVGNFQTKWRSWTHVKLWVPAEQIFFCQKGGMTIRRLSIWLFQWPEWARREHPGILPQKECPTSNLSHPR